MKPELHYLKPANSFNEALPIGNGKIGGVVYGGTKTERISLNEDTLWSGYPKEIVKKNAPEIFKKFRKMTLDGNAPDAQKIEELEFTANYSDIYLPLGNLYIKSEIDNADNYSRRLDMENGIAYTDFSDGENIIHREAFVSYNKKALCVFISSSEKLNFEISLDSQLKSTLSESNEIYMLKGECPVLKFSDEHDHGEEIYTDNDNNRGMLFLAALKVLSDGKVSYYDEKVLVENAKNTYIFLSAHTSFSNFNINPFTNPASFVEPCIRDIDKVAENGYEAVKKEHIDDFSALFNRTYFDINTNSEIPTNELLNSDKKDNALYELLFNMGKYLTISSSRENSEPSNLQGIWNENLEPPWHSNFTININTEMNYWPTLPLNLKECYKPFLKLCEDLKVSGRKTAKNFFNAKGSCCFHNTDLWRITRPIGNGKLWCGSYSFWPFGEAWLTAQLLDYCKYFENDNNLSKTLSIVEENAEFLLSMLNDDGDGHLVFTPSTSPENGYITENGIGTSFDISSTLNNTLIIAIFKGYIDLCKKTNKTTELLENVKIALSKLKPLKIASDGTIIEWHKEHKEAEPHHRHVSHLVGFYPLDMVSPDEDEKLCEAAKKTLIKRGDEGTGWCIAWKAGLWAKLREGNHSLKLLNNQLKYVESDKTDMSGGGTYPNMLCAHSPFQIDGNFGATFAIIQMIVQCDGKNLLILPALPDKWKDGCLNGIRIKGDSTVNISWKSGKLENFEIFPEENKQKYNIKIF